MGLPWKYPALLSVTASFLTVQYLPNYSLSASYVLNSLAFFVILVVGGGIWTVILYPKLFHPLRHLPSPSVSHVVNRPAGARTNSNLNQGGSFFWGHFRNIVNEPTGEPHQRWVNEVPNEGLIHYRTMFNESRLLPTTPKALAEVLVQKNYEFIKPAQFREGFGRILGIGVLLAEGEVSTCLSFFSLT